MSAPDLALTPGAPRAKASGCLCPAWDNGHGRGAFHDVSGVMLYVIREDCPMHGSEGVKRAEEKEETNG